MSYSARTPVVIVAGFLGAGKTTLLKSVLASPEFAHTMVIVNEIGEIGIDHHLLERSEEETVLLGNGCMCCQLRGDLQTLLVNLKMRVDRGELPSFERVVVEMSGLADPGPVAQTLYSDAALIHDYRVARIATLIDPLSLEAIQAAPAVAESQISAADLLIVSKTDVADEAQVRAVVEWARSINPFADCMTAARGEMDVALLAKTQVLDAVAAPGADRAWSVRRPAAMFGGAGGEAPEAGPDAGAPEGSYLARRFSLHPPSVGSFVIRFPDPPPRFLFDLFIATLARLRGQDLLRVKGLVRFEDGGDPYLIQGVRHVFAEPVRLKADALGAAESSLVVVARHMRQREVEALWQALKALSG